MTDRIKRVSDGEISGLRQMYGLHASSTHPVLRLCDEVELARKVVEAAERGRSNPDNRECPDCGYKPMPVSLGVAHALDAYNAAMQPDEVEMPTDEAVAEAITRRFFKATLPDVEAAIAAAIRAARERRAR